MSRAATLLLLCAAVLLCVVGGASAQGSTSASVNSKYCSFMDYLPSTTPEPGFTVTYPNNSITYVRQTYPLPPETFFIANWYVGIILIIVAVCGAYILLGLWICYHFEFCDQRKAKKVVEESYVTKGYFDIDRYVDRKDRAETRSAQAEMEEMRSNRSRSFRASNSYDDSYDDESYSDDYSSNGSSPSDDDEGVVDMNPLRR